MSNTNEQAPKQSAEEKRTSERRIESQKLEEAIGFLNQFLKTSEQSKSGFGNFHAFTSEISEHRTNVAKWLIKHAEPLQQRISDLEATVKMQREALDVAFKLCNSISENLAIYKGEFTICENSWMSDRVDEILKAEQPLKP